MPDFLQTRPITTIHDLGTIDRQALDEALVEAAENYKIGLVLPITASDMRAEPFAKIVQELTKVKFIDTIVVVLNRAPDIEDYVETKRLIAPLGKRAHVLWTDGPRGSKAIRELADAGFNVSVPGKGRAVWMAFGFLLADPRLKAFALHDCDIVDYNHELLSRLCLPMAHSSLDFDFCKAYYARVTKRMHGRVARLLVAPLLQALVSIHGSDRFLVYLKSFRYPLSGEFAVTSTLARSNRIPSDWGLEIGTLSEVFRNTSLKRVCQVDIGTTYEHKHQALSLDNPQKGLMKMALDILTSIVRTLSSRGMVFQPGHFATLRAAYMRTAQDSVRQYHADALVNGLEFDRHLEEEAIEGFAEQITAAGEIFANDPSGGDSIPNWTRVLTAFPDFPQKLRQIVADDEQEYAS